ncbi:conserved hypothetical membrane protein [Thermoplasma acidophilum]|uniref:Conserved hypothetical membrane protein n=1 Tax=Thermoplasma acidophilum (strain ATCC 25905 / DSM 1728 / JCM 9062 / NBRC 15155 / AMRC-C165) TaxID=273075 RepID=Q9HJI2_THEAC|nr:DUF998 domain-containing protein [Thermoplasma acidophilum]CAC12115.1 conserved hypothetical membrane protein [Thermoplasma acidophilum]
MIKNYNKTPKFLIIIASIAIASAWITILISALLNPWFSVTHNALSDLGGGNLLQNGHPAPTDPFVYNGGMILTGVFIALFSVDGIINAQDKVENAGFSFFIISGLFLCLIGIYHEGTYPHDFVSIWFFILSTISFATLGISRLIRKRYGTGMIILSMLITSWIVEYLVRWGSVAESEIFGICIIDAAVIIYVLSWSPKSVKHPHGQNVSHTSKK